MALQVAPPPLREPGMGPERQLAEQRAGVPTGGSAMEHLSQAGQSILAAAKLNPAVAERAGEIISLLTQLTQDVMAEGGQAAPEMPSPPPMPGRPGMMA